MTLGEIILGCNEYQDLETEIYFVFAKRIDNAFQYDSDAVILKIPVEDLEKQTFEELSEKYCPGYEYFLENFIIQDFYNDISELEEFRSDTAKKVNRVIYYAEYDA